MSFLKQLFNNWLGGGKIGGHHGYSGYSKHGSPYYPPNYGPNSQAAPPVNLNTNTCSKCLASNPASARFCQQCGNAIGPTTCTNCNATLAIGTKFCNQCGKQQ